MHIKKISLTGFRSIYELEIDIKKISNRTCYILIGRNETGKSNILKSIALENDSIDCDFGLDCNKEVRKDNSFIQTCFELGFDDYGHYQKIIDKAKYPERVKKAIEIEKVEKYVDVEDDGEKNIYIWTTLKNNEVYSKYVLNSTSGEIELITDIYDGEELLTKKNIKEILGEEYALLTRINLSSQIDSLLSKTILYNTPDIIYWEPSAKYLIDEPISLSEFKEDSSISIPLKNIFKISGISKIKERLELIDSYEDRAQLEQELSIGITNYINKIWKEHEINIVIRIEEEFCKVMVEDKDNTVPKYQMSQRSDGFKQFISILLNLSIENQTNEIKNKIILLDEPEVHMHPSGIKYLRDELLNIAKNNLVFVASHSIYMIDKLNLDRHIKVEKDNSRTTIKTIAKDNPYEEELIYESLGTSIYEHIEPNMIVFEGKTDKDIFDAFTKKFRIDIKPVKIGTISADGVQKIPQYLKFFNGKFVQGYVLVDSDNDGKTIKEKVKKDFSKFNSKNTFEINDFTGQKIPSTLEDLFPIEVIKSIILDEYKIEMNFDSNKAIIKQLIDKNKQNKTKINIDLLKSSIVHYILADISKLNKNETIEKYKRYYEFLIKFHSKLKE